MTAMGAIISQGHSRAAMLRACAQKYGFATSGQKKEKTLDVGGNVQFQAEEELSFYIIFNLTIYQKYCQMFLV